MTLMSIDCEERSQNYLADEAKKAWYAARNAYAILSILCLAIFIAGAMSVQAVPLAGSAIIGSFAAGQLWLAQKRLQQASLVSSYRTPRG